MGCRLKIFNHESHITILPVIIYFYNDLTMKSIHSTLFYPFINKYTDPAFRYRSHRVIQILHLLVLFCIFVAN